MFWKNHRRAAVRRAFPNAWAVYAQVYSRLYQCWMEQPVALFPTQHAALAHAREWVVQ